METKAREKTGQAGVFAQVAQQGHEQVVFCFDEPTGLKAVIAIHNTVLGPALGGTRMWQYTSEEEAVTDVLRLSRGMTYKAAISGLNLGGGKAVIIGDASTQKTEAFLRRFGRFVNSLNGKYYTAEDVNMKTADMEFIAMETRFVTGLPEASGGGGDPSPVTAYGVYMGMKAGAKRAFGSDSLAGKRIAVQGVGQVGAHLVEYLNKENARVFVSDIDEKKVKAVAARFGAEPLAQDLFDLEFDIYAPCALGATLNDQTIPRLKCAVVAGAANNQLKDELKNGYQLMDRGIVYAPDFVINAGGLMNVYQEYSGNYQRERVYAQAEKIYYTTLQIMDFARREKINNQEAAIQLAEQRIREVGRLRMAR
jgi:leucine dehydrogenase